MAEYIDREGLGIGKCNPEIFDDKGYANGWNSAIDIIQSAPAADVRPVVLCRDCKYWKQWDNTSHYLCTYVAGAKFIREANDFCSRGARMEES